MGLLGCSLVLGTLVSLVTAGLGAWTPATPNRGARRARRLRAAAGIAFTRGAWVA